ncbi:MAG: hypothetical protein ACR2H0_03155 [Candidatus Limnocylindrales bacterium]
MDEQAVRDHADAFCAALIDGDVERAAADLSTELRSNLGQLVAMLPMPLAAASVESIERTASGFRAVLHLVGETTETRLETRWKNRDDRPVVVEVSHLTEDAVSAADSDSEQPTEPEE